MPFSKDPLMVSGAKLIFDILCLVEYIEESKML